MSSLKPSEKRGGYSGSKPMGPIVVPTSKGASVTPTPSPNGPAPKPS